MSRYFLFAGEPSGDLHGSRLIPSLKKLDPAARFDGVGGPLMRDEGLHSLLKMEDFQVMGFSDVIKAFPKLYRQFYQIRDAILKDPPDCVILIDYPGFNLRLAKALRKKGYKGKIVQYICPTVWAHGKKRIDTMVQTLDLLLTIFPFEAAYFAHSSLKVKYIGNPLVENQRNRHYQENWRASIGIPIDADLIALFPGSRPGEIAQHGALMVQIAERMIRDYREVRFAFSCAHEQLRKPLEELIEKSSLKLGCNIFLVSSQYSHELMEDCQCALAKSGTVTLELALHQKPTVVIYKLSKLNYFIAKYLMRLNLPHYCIVNILSQKETFPEFIGKSIDAGRVLNTLERLHKDMYARETIIKECQQIQEQLGQKQTHDTAAQAIREIVKTGL